MTSVATKFVPRDTPSLDSLRGSIVYKIRALINSGTRLNRTQKNWITNKVKSNSYFKNSVALQWWMFHFSEVLKKFDVKQDGSCQEYYAVDKTSLREYLGSNVEYIVEIK